MLNFSACGGWFKCDYYNSYAEAKKFGFGAIEHLGWTGVDAGKLSETVGKTGVSLSAVICDSKSSEAREKLAWSHGLVYEDTLPYYVSSMEETLEFCKKTGVKNIIATTGNARIDESRWVQHDNVVKALKTAAPMLEGTGIQIILEPLNVITDHMGHFLNTSPEGFAMIREVDHPCVKLLYDIYHQQVTEGNLISTIKNNISLIGHFHVADVPGRREPGTGEINYKNVFRAIAEADYTGYTAFECGLSEDVETVVKKMFALAE